MQDEQPAPSGSAAPTRRQLLLSMGAGAAALALGSFDPVSAGQPPARDLSPVLPKLARMRDGLQDAVRPRALAVAKESFARDVGGHRYTYAVDVGQMLCYYALTKDREPYLALRDFAMRELVVDLKDDPFTRGFVLWRCRPGEPRDASGTTEALRLAKGLWIGADAFARPDDRDLSLTILEGYGRHQNVDQGYWLIRNYFHFASRAFASNSFIIDYDPDFVRQVADALPGDPRQAAMSELADHSRDVLKAAGAPCGLPYDLLQPELATMYYGLNVAYFSPNDIIQTNNAATTAITVARTAPQSAHDALSFISDRIDKIYAHYYGRTGENVNNTGIGATEYCAIIRLAAAMGDRYVVGRCVEQAMPFWEWAIAKGSALDVWTTSELLLGLHAVLELGPAPK